MAAGKTKIKRQAIAVSHVALALTAEVVPSCEALYAASEAIQALIAENCPIASQMRAAKKLPVKAKQK